MKVKEVFKIIEKDHRVLSRTKGSHQQYKHEVKSGLVTAAGHTSDDLAPKTLKSIFKIRWN